MSMKTAYEQKLQAQLDGWSAEIDKLKAKADSAEADAQLEYYKKIEALRSMRETATNKLTELKDTSDDTWDSLGNALKSATSKLK